MSALCHDLVASPRLERMDITGNTVFIPGATSGIGLALALRLHEAGNTVIIGGRRPERLAEIAAEHRGIHTLLIDTTDVASIRTASGHVTHDYPDLDVVVTMAGVMRAEDWTHPDLAVAEEIVTTNVLGPIRLIAALLPHLQTRPRATIMTVSSGLAFVPLAATPTYNASKAAIHMLSESLRLQLADTRVRVVELVPPAVQTDLMPGQATSDHAMPLAAFVDEVWELLQHGPDTTEILVERVKLLRHAEARGDYARVTAAVNAQSPHRA